MSTIALALILLVALLHLYFLVLEMFLWTRPLGLKTFRNTPEKAQATRVLAAKPGLVQRLPGRRPAVRGGDRLARVRAVLPRLRGGGRAHGAWSVNKRIFFVQAVPALLALAAVCCL